MSVEAILKDLDAAGGDDDGGSGDKDSGAGGSDSNAGTDDGKSGDTSGDAGETGDKSATSDGDTGGTGDDDSGDGTKDTDPLEILRTEQAELRQMLRVSRRENATMKAKLDRVGSKKDDKVEGDDEFDDDKAGEADKGDEKLSHIEELQNTLQTINQSRGASLEVLAEQMAETKKYADIASVCSRQNMDDVIEAAANSLIEQNGGDFNELILELETSIWSKQNPYRYLYDLVKTYHPKYQKAGDDSTGKKSTEKTASSIQDMGGAGDKNSGKGGWTADKIDAMPEDELSKVPADIYDKYLAGELS
jgi:hypothetical protein